MIRHSSKQRQAELDGLHRLLDKSIALTAAGDALAYQSIQLSDYARYDATEEEYDPSDAGEMERIAARDGTGDLNGSERDVAESFGDDHFAPGF